MTHALAMIIEMATLHHGHATDEEEVSK